MRLRMHAASGAGWSTSSQASINRKAARWTADHASEPRLAHASWEEPLVLAGLKNSLVAGESGIGRLRY
jgi:hypothetical protein